MKKTLLKVVAASLVVFMLAACSGGNDPTEPVDNIVQNGNDVVTPQDIDVDYWGNPLYEIGPDGNLRPLTAGFTEHPMNLGGREVVLLLGHLPNSLAWGNFNYWEDIDQTPNETLEVMRKMRLIEENYNVVFINEMAQRGSGLRDQLMLAQLTGETPWDIMIIGTGHLSLDGVFPHNLLMDMNHPSIREIIDLENNPWRIESELTRMYGRQFGVHFPISNSGDMLRTMLTFNKNHAETFNLGNLFDMVWNNTWTFDALESLSSQIVNESNGRIIPIIDGWGGFITHALIASNNGAIAQHTADGGMRFVAHENDNTLEAMDFFQRMVNQNFLQFEPGDRQEGIIRMANGQAVFLTGSYENLRIFTRQQFPTEYNFGLLPIPMGPRANDFVTVTPHTEIYTILNNIERPNEIAAIIVAMANRLTKLNIVETELMFGLQDEESARVLEFMLDRIVIDFSVLTGVRHNIGGAMALIQSGQQTPRAAFETIAMVVQANYDSTQGMFED